MRLIYQCLNGSIYKPEDAEKIFCDTDQPVMAVLVSEPDSPLPPSEDDPIGQTTVYAIQTLLADGVFVC
jgi:hypothetical protein